jgi:prepilin-type N-terminal cleavage/methylation domain-containing protein
MKNGFTLLELMVVIVIIGVLIAIAIPNFIASQDRAKVAALKSNMHAFQEAVETYAVDWSGIYPGDANAVRTEGIDKNYWRDFKNPFSGLIDNGTSVLNSVSNSGDIDPSNFPAGNTSYKKDTITNGYAIYGADKDNGKSIIHNGKPFFLTNS